MPTNRSTTLRSVLIALAALAPAALRAGEVTPPRIIQTVEARFPAELDHSVIGSGQAVLLISVAADGTLGDVLPAAYTHEAFAREARATLQQWRYEPATQDGKPISVRVALNFEFTTSTRVVTLTPLDTLAALTRTPALNAGRNLLATMRELDQPVAIERSVSPTRPAGTAPEVTGKVTVDFYVDQSGNARLPVIRAATSPEFAEAAIHALAGWKFNPPRRQGKGVIVRLQQDFVFTPAK